MTQKLLHPLYLDFLSITDMMALASVDKEVMDKYNEFVLVVWSSNEHGWLISTNKPGHYLPIIYFATHPHWLYYLMFMYNKLKNVRIRGLVPPSYKWLVQLIIKYFVKTREHEGLKTAGVTLKQILKY